MDGDVLVIGGGVSGITAALELAEKDFKVFLVEKEPSIGGYMAKLDKTFPTLDCSICILGPKMVEVARHPNIKLFSYAEVKELERIQNGSKFTVKVIKMPRYVDESKCTGCRRCEEKCPVKIPSEFEEGVGFRKSIYIPFPQAVPNVAVIDREHCLYFTKGVCKVCEKMCPAGAINFEQKPEEVTLNVYSIILSTGYSLLDPSILPQYGFGRFRNVLTSIQYERFMNAAGPTRGEIVRPSDGKHPKTVAIIQCVGSRNKKLRDYCSQICCMYATKQAIVTKEHDPSIDVIIFYNDLNASGKGHEELVRRAIEEYGIKYIKSLPSEVMWDDKTDKLIIRYADLSTGEVKNIYVDLVVLCPAAIPRKDSFKLAQILGVELNEHGFFKSEDTVPVSTNIPGIYVCGACQNPKDISHSVMQALAAAAEAAKRVLSLRERKGILLSKEATSVHDTVEDLDLKPRVGVFVCHCGLNIASVVNVKEVVEKVSRIPDVVHAEDLMFACSKDGVERIKEAIKKHDLNRVVVASCTPSTHEKLFRSICGEAGLNPYLFEMVNIREQVSWVHRKYPNEATEKAEELIRMAVAKAKLLEPLKKIESPITPSALIIGGTVSGLVAAKMIAESGFKVYIVEQEDSLGKDIDFYQHDGKITAWFSDLVESLYNNKNVEIHLSTKIEDVKGSIGNFIVKIEKDGLTEEVTVGTIIVALSGEELKPLRKYGYGEDDRVVTLTEFKKMGYDGGDDIRRLVFILCVGAREKIGRAYCSSICCEEAVEEALKFKRKHPQSNVYIIYRDIRLPVSGEKLYREAREAGIIFLRYDEDKPPEVTSEDNVLLVNVHDTTINTVLEIPVDKIILATPIQPSKMNPEFSSKLKVPLNSYGFFIESHPKLRPVDFSVDGIFLSGLAYGPQRLKESLCQGLASASRALTTLIRGKIVVEPIVAEVNSQNCTGCGRCLNSCEFGAIKLRTSSENALVAEINPLLCKGCGSCAVECPAKAISMHYFRNDQILSMIEAAFEKPSPRDRPRIIAFFCNWCGYAAADMAGVSRYEYPPSIEIIRVMCTARVDPLHILYALLSGADGVLVIGCHPGDCHYISGNLKAKDRIEQLRELISRVGFEPERVRIDWASAGEGLRLSKIIEEFTHKIEEIGYSPMRRCQ